MASPSYWQRTLKNYVGKVVKVFGNDAERPLAIGTLTDLGVNHIRVVDENGGKTELHYDVLRMVFEPWKDE